MGLGLLLVIWLITFASSYFFLAKTWWMPALASVEGLPIDHQFTVTYILMGIVFVAAQVGLGLFVWKYRDRGTATTATYSHGNNKLEAVWTVLTAVMFLGLGAMSSSIWAQERFQPAGAGALPVEVTGLQFQWYFRYPGADGKFGRTKPELEDPSSGGEAALGIDPSDATGKDDVVTNTLVVPVNREIDFIIRAQDVIHSFYVPAMRFKQDAVPGLMIHLHYTPNLVGDYEIACAELCGLGHYKMRAMMRVVSEQDYQKWMAERVAEKAQ